MRNGKPNPPNMRRMRYNKWVDRACALLKETDKAMTTKELMEALPDDRFRPKSGTGASQKLRKDPRIGQYYDYVKDLSGSNSYKVSFWFYEGDVFEE